MSHPVYENKRIRALFSPRDPADLNESLKKMVGHEFIWQHIGQFGNEPLWAPADPEDIDAYFEIRQSQPPSWKALWILEEDLEILRVDNLDA